jgi:hypothetical protein
MAPLLIIPIPRPVRTCPCMNDLIFVSVIVAFFAGSVVYAACCEKL